MSTNLPVGPYREITLKNGKRAPFYIMPFDEDGRATAVKTREHLVKDATAGGYSHIFVFSHGWNNDFETALARYNSFIAAFQAVVPHDSPLMRDTYKPLLVGVTWPSIDLLFDWEEGPALSSTPPAQRPEGFDRSVRKGQDELRLVAGLLPADKRAEFYDIASNDRPMTDAEGIKLARLIAPLYATSEDPTEPDGAPPTPEQLVRFWETAVMDAKAGLVEPGIGPASPTIKALPFGLPDPRDVVRVFTVWKMKDRAGKVGSTGVSNLLRDLISAAPAAKVHLIGHSFGCKLLLSAIAVGSELARPVTSVLLLQPAVSCYCFSSNVAGRGFPGGYRPTLVRIAQPILATFSSHDLPLTRVYHLALRRQADLGDTRTFEVGPPSEYSALGGVGPFGVSATEAQVIDIKVRGDPYQLGSGTPEVYGIRGDRAIDGHSGVINEVTAWALYCQATA
jgi:hypothetical protein